MGLSASGGVTRDHRGEKERIFFASDNLALDEALLFECSWPLILMMQDGASLQMQSCGHINIKTAEGGGTQNKCSPGPEKGGIYHNLVIGSHEHKKDCCSDLSSA